MVLQLVIEILFYAGVVNSHYSCLTWELNGQNLSLICRTQNQIEPVSFIDSKGNLKAKCTLNNPSQCKTFQTNANTTANTYKNEVVFMINDYERKQIINDEWTCSQGNRTLKTVVSTSKGILSDTDLTLSLLHSSSLQSVTLICVSCRAPHGNHAEFLIDDKSVDSIRYNMVTGTCTHVNGKCLPDKCSCIPSGNEFTRMFPFIAINKTTNFSCRMKFVDNDKSSIFSMISRVSYNGQEFIYNGTETIISKPPINDEKRNVSDDRNNNRTDSNHDVVDAGEIFYWVVIGVAVAMPCVVAVIVKLCCRSLENTQKGNDGNEQKLELLHRTGDTEDSGGEEEKLSKAQWQVKQGNDGNEQTLERLHRTGDTEHSGREEEKLIKTQWQVKREENFKLTEAQYHVDQFYVETRMFLLVMDALESNYCVTLIGASGEGKTVTAKHAALNYGHKFPSLEVLEIFKPNELLNSIDMDKHQFFLVNDPLGKQCLDESSLGDWVQMSKRLRNFLACGHTKIVATIRKPLFKKNENRIRETIFRECVIDFSSEINRLSIEDKTRILEKNIKHTGRELDSSVKNNLITDTHNPGFPLLCRLISSNPNRYIHDTVDPCLFLIEELKSFLAVKPFYYCCIVLVFMHDNVFDINDLAPCKNIKFSDPDINVTKKIDNIIDSCNISTDEPDSFLKLKRGFRDLSGAYFINNNPVYTNLHDSITNAVAYTYGKDNIQMILRYSSSSVIREYVRTKQSAEDDQNVIFEIIVSSELRNKLAIRFIQDIELGDSVNVFLNPSFLDEEFQSIFLEELMAMNKYEMLEIMSMTPHEVSPELKDIREYTKFALDIAILSASPIHWLCRLGLCEILIAVLSKTENKLKFLNKLNVHTTPLHFAAGYGKLDVVRYLISIGVDINVKSQLQMLKHPKIGEYSTGFPPLLYAARQNHPDVVEYMLQHGADPNLVRDHGGSPLLLAADRGHTEVIKHLLEYKGNPDLCCDHGTTPLILAAQGGHLESVMALIEGNADLNWQRFENEGKTSALLAAAKNGHLKCAEVLVNHGANIELSDVNGSSPLLLALQNQHIDTARALFKLGASINATSNSGKSPSQLAKILELEFTEDA